MTKNRILNLRDEVKMALELTWRDDGVIDPEGLSATRDNGEIKAEAVSFAARKLPQPYTEHLVCDIETFSNQPQLLHFGLFANLQGLFSEPFRTLDEIIEHVEARLFYRCATSETNPRIRIWAHNGAAFDFVGIASEIRSTENMPILRDERIDDPTEILENFKSRLKSAARMSRDSALQSQLMELIGGADDYPTLRTKIEALESRCSEFLDRQNLAMALKRATLKSVKTDEIAQGVSRDSTRPIVRKYKLRHPLTNRPNLLTFEWSIHDNGTRPVLQCQLKRGKSHRSGSVHFTDMMWHATLPLHKIGKDLGFPKGETPLQYTSPFEWGDQQGFDYDIRAESDRFFQDWHAHLDPKAVEYCRQDLSIMIEFLKFYKKEIAELMPPTAGITIDPLDFLTAPQLGHTLQLAHMMLGAKSNSKIHIVYETAKVKIEREKIDINGNEVVDEHETYRPTFKLLRSEDELHAFYAKHGSKVVHAKVPLVSGSNPTVFDHKTFFIYRRFQEAWGHVSFGGRTEVFSPVTPEGHYDLAIDANSMYPSIMSDSDCRLINTNRIVQLKQDIKGRDAILRYFAQGVSGMYLIESTPPIDPNIRKYPIFPIRLSGREYDSQLAFRHWDGKLRLYVTGEELKYFLESTDVERDDIRIIADGSYHAPLLPFDPLKAFADKLYAKRKEARSRGDDARSFIYKMLMNSAGFGTLGQINSQYIEFTENEIEKQKTCIARLQRYSPNWGGWQGKLSEKHLLNLIREWAADHYKNVIEYRNYNGVTVYRLPLPADIARHALRPWSSAITAYARVKLHRAMMSAIKAGFEIAYCDTDSLHISVPMVVKPQEAMQRLDDADLWIDPDELGAWKFEPAEANTELLTAGADVDADGNINRPRLFALAPKHYAYADQQGNCLAVKAKGIPSDSTAMRVGLKQFILKHSALGDRRGIVYNVSWVSDLERKIGEWVKRDYIDAHTSRAIVMKQPEDFIGTWKQYKAEIADVAGVNHGVYEALDQYKNLMFKGRTYLDIRARLDEAFEDIAIRAADKRRVKDIKTEIEKANLL